MCGCLHLSPYSLANWQCFHSFQVLGRSISFIPAVFLAAWPPYTIHPTTCRYKCQQQCCIWSESYDLMSFCIKFLDVDLFECVYQSWQALSYDMHRPLTGQLEGVIWLPQFDLRSLKPRLDFNKFSLFFGRILKRLPDCQQCAQNLLYLYMLFYSI